MYALHLTDGKLENGLVIIIQLGPVVIGPFLSDRLSIKTSETRSNGPAITVNSHGQHLLSFPTFSLKSWGHRYQVISGIHEINGRPYYMASNSRLTAMEYITVLDKTSDTADPFISALKAFVDFFRVYVDIVIIMIGISGNILSLVIFGRYKHGDHASVHYLSWLSGKSILSRRLNISITVMKPNLLRWL
jgi:hypothetical protein